MDIGIIYIKLAGWCGWMDGWAVRSSILMLCVIL